MRRFALFPRGTVLTDGRVRTWKRGCSSALVALALGLWATGLIGWEATILATGVAPTPSSLANLPFLGGSDAIFLVLVAALRRRERSFVGPLDVATIAASLLV